MRILMTTDAVGGVWQYATTLAETLAEHHGVQVLLAVCGPRPSEDQLSTLRVGPCIGGGQVEVELLDLPLEWDGGTDEQYAGARRTLLELALLWHAHILHANEHHLGAIAASGLPVLVVSHSDLQSWHAAVYPETLSTVDGRYVARVRAGVQEASLVVAPSTYVAAALSRWYGYGGVVRVIPNGVHDQQTSLTPLRTIDAMIAGRLWDPAKNLECFVRALDQLARGTFVAAGPLQAAGQPPAAWTATHIEYAGVLPHGELRAMLARSRILVSPARYDPFGLVAVEAALEGCCLILSDIPSYRAIWGPNATYFNPNDPAALARLLQALLEDASRRHELGAQARQHARAHYSAERMGEAYHASYQRLALRHGLAT